MIDGPNDFLVPLMRILDSLPNRAGKTEIVVKLFGQHYHNQISQHLFSRDKTGHIRWEWRVRWTREALKQLGYIDSPAIGVWRLTEEGHQWLLEHSSASHLSIEKSKSGPMKKPYQNKAIQKARGTDLVTADELFVALQEALKDPLRTVLDSIPFEFFQKSNYLQVRMAGYGGCHYEIILRRDKHEIALHFESSPSISQARLREFEPHIDFLSQALEMPIFAGDFGSRGWTQIHIERVSRPLRMTLVNEYVDLSSRFIAATLPILINIYAGKKGAHLNVNEKNIAGHPMHATLEQEVACIWAYLEGRSTQQISDEKLCDWVTFCYFLELYKEARDLFTLVSPGEVNSWYYDRTKKIAKICEMRSTSIDLL